MILQEIRNYPTKITRDEMQQWLDKWVKGVHESVLRSYSILQEVKEMLRRGDSIETIQAVIEFYESPDFEKEAEYVPTKNYYNCYYPTMTICEQCGLPKYKWSRHFCARRS